MDCFARPIKLCSPANDIINLKCIINKHAYYRLFVTSPEGNNTFSRFGEVIIVLVSLSLFSHKFDNNCAWIHGAEMLFK